MLLIFRNKIRAMRINNLKNTKIPEIIDGTLQEKFNYYFKYDNGDLIIKNKWALSTQIGKFVDKYAIINKESFKKEYIIWAMHNGPINDGMTIVRIDPEFGYRLENLKLEKYKHLNGRPKGIVDKGKRKIKKFLTAKEERYIKENWLNYCNNHFANKFNINKSTVSTIARSLGLCKKISISSKVSKCNDINLLRNKVGVYVIVTSNNKVYIGSSSNIFNRITAHLNLLNKSEHYNKSLNNDWDEKGWYGILEECDEQKLIERENYYINNTSNTHNTWVYIEISKEMIDILKCKILDKIVLGKNGCWNYTGYIDKAGYGQISTYKNRKRRPTHRIMYFAHNLEESQDIVIRHTCGNKKCCNPDHLKSGSYRDNGLDNKREEMELFEKRFVETEYDYKLLMKEFSLTYKTVFSRIKSRGLFDKYPNLKKRLQYNSGEKTR